MKSLRTSFIFAFCFIAAPALVWAASFVMPSDAELIDSADSIVIATAGVSLSQENSLVRIVTVTDFTVERVLKGAGLGSTIQLTGLGGRIADQFVLVPGTPRFRESERVLLFLEQTPRGEWRVLDMVLGKFNFARDEHGESLVVRSLHDASIFTRDGSEHRERARSETKFLNFIAARLRGEAPAEDYFLDSEPSDSRTIAPMSHRTPFLLSIPGVGAFRWQNPTASFTRCEAAACPTPSGLNGISAITNGMGLWNAAGAGVNYSLSGTTTNTAPTTTAAGGSDGNNNIVYNDPHDLVSGTFGSGSNTLGIGIVYGDFTYTLPGDSEVFINIPEGDVVMNNGISSGNIMQAVLDAAMAHELGHTLGLQHSDEAPAPHTTTQAVMNSFVFTGCGGLCTYDLNAITTVYGSGGPSPCVEGVIPNFEVEASTPTGATFTWSAPAGVTNPVYEVVRDEAPTDCDLIQRFFSPDSPVDARLTTTRHTVVFPQERALCYRVRLEGCDLFDTPYCFVFWNFSTPPLMPNLISAVATGPAAVTVTYSHPDARTGLFLQRAGSSGTFQFVAFLLDHCPAGTVMTYVDTGEFSGGPLPPDTYQYRLIAITEAAETFSNVITVVVGGGAPCVPPQVAPQVTSPNTNVRAGEPATINWTTSETVERFVIEVSAAGTTRSFSVPGSQRSATFSFPQAGTFSVKVFAENSCGRKEGVPVITFNVTPRPAELVLITPSPSMLGIPGAPAATDAFTLANLGETATSVELVRSGTFFVHQPAQFTLAPQGRQVVTVTATTQTTGQHQGEVIATGTGGAGQLRVPVALLVETRPSGNPDPQPDANRVDVAAPPSESPTGTVRFENRGNGTVKGILLADPWIILLEKFLIIAPGGSATISFRIERSLRPSDQGSEVGTIILVYLEGAPAKTAAWRTILGATPPPGSKSTLVTVTDTVKPTVTAGAIPAIAANEVAYFVSGVGHTVTAGGAVTKSDVAVLNTSLADLQDLRVFFAAAGGVASAQGASFSALSADQTLKMSDVTKSLFSAEVPAGTLQIRANALSALTVDARTFLENPSGTVGARIPVFRSDRGAAAQEKLYLTGLKKEGTSYRTDLYVQEISGQAGSAEIQFLTASGASAGGNQTVSLEPFGMTRLEDRVPAGAVAAVVTNTSTAGRIQAYATVTDLRTSDSWPVADWSRVHGYAGNAPVVVPVAGKVRGRNNTDFRSDLAIMNTATTSASGTLTYQPEVGPSVSRMLTLGAGESRILTDVLAAQFNLTGQGLGYLVFTPTSGSFAVSSRTYTQSATGVTLSAGVPAVPLTSALKAGQARKISNLEDVTHVSVTGAKPGTFRTNFGLLETAGKAAKVRATLRYTAVQGAASAAGVASQEFSLAPGQFLMWSSITTAILQARRGEFGDLRDLQADFELIEGPGEVIVFTTSTDNGTNDTSVRVE